MTEWTLLLTCLNTTLLVAGLGWLWSTRREAGAVGGRNGQSVALLGAHLFPLRERMAQMRSELDRARRYERPLCMAVLRIEEPESNSGQPVGKKGKPEQTRPLTFSFMVAGYAIFQTLRSTDLMAYDAGRGCFHLCLPEVGQGEGEATMQRLRTLVLERTGLSVKCGLSEFPTEGWTLEELMEGALAQLDKRPAVLRKKAHKAVSA